jgi:DNA-binding TFAR19-related protein (PDSD5 family)
MQLTAGDLREFKNLYKRHFDIALDDDTARSKLMLLVLQMQHVYAPITEDQLVELLSRHVNDDRNDNEPRTSEAD